MQKARIVSLAAAVPPHVISQADAASFATSAFGGRFEGFEQVAGVFMTSGIRRRRAVRPLDGLLRA